LAQKAKYPDKKKNFFLKIELSRIEEMEFASFTLCHLLVGFTLVLEKGLVTCLIHNDHLWKIPSFHKILDPKILHSKKNYD
jgi:hypothetical protein